MAADRLPGGGEGPDEAYPHRADGDGADEGAPTRPGDAGRAAVQPGQVVRQHARAAQDVAREHRSHSREERRPLGGQRTRWASQRVF